MNLKFSIIMPLYNKVPYICKALESVVAQTYRDFELIVVDDGSTDNSLEIVKEFAEQIDKRWIDGRITIISQPNTGVAAARNNGVKASNGEYICFLDADDWWEPTFLEEMDKLIQKYPDAGIYTTNFIYYKHGKTHVEHNKQYTGYIDYPSVYCRTGSMPVWTSATCMPRKIFDEMGGFPIGIKLGEDFLLWAKTALHYPVVFCEKPLAYYNNEIPASLRATRNLHDPEHNMLFHLDSIEEELRNLSLPTVNTLTWKVLLDKLRISGLMEYWLEEKYHDVAEQELKKIDWSKQPKSERRQYKMPIWLLKGQKYFMQVGSYYKQKLINKLYRRKQ